MFLRYSSSSGLFSVLRKQTMNLATSRFQSFSNREYEAFKKKYEEDKKKSEVEESKSSVPFTQIYLGKGTDAIIERRRMQAEIRAKEEEKSSQVPAFFESYGDAVVEFELYFEHDTHDSQLADAIMSYYEIAYRKNDNYVYLDRVKYHYEKELKDFKVNISLEPAKYIMGSREILNYLLNTNFIFNPKHISGSAYTDQTIEFIRNDIKPQIEAIFWAPILTIENLYHSAARTYRSGQRSDILLDTLKFNFKKIGKQIWENRKLKKENRETYKNARETLLSKLTEWGQRLNGQDFHGGNMPDEADFELYALIKTKWNSRSFQTFIERKCPEKFYRWFVRMQMKCRYEADRIMLVM